MDDPHHHPDDNHTTLSGGRYVIAEKLGEGGMGAVYRARDRHLQTEVVIKRPHPSMVVDAEFSRRFRDEVRSLVRLSHPHIVKITDTGEWDGAPFAVLQFLSGGSLEDRLTAWKGPAAVAALVSWLGPVSSALDYVHSQKMVHRDVKPGNILFDAQGHAFLGDFGVVKVLAEAADRRSVPTAAMTGTGMVLGTPYYMAPELIMGEAFDGRVDQYALAVTAYELVGGRRPFEHEVATRLLLMHAQDQPPGLTTLCPWVTPRLEATLFKALAKDPDDRYPSCAAFSAAVIAASGVEPGGRMRLRCGSCGQTMTIAVEVLAEMSRSGRRAPCPKCRNLLDLAGGGGTAMLLLPPPGHSNEPDRRAATVLEPRRDAPTKTWLSPSPPSPAAGTVVFGGQRKATVLESRPELTGDTDDDAGAATEEPRDRSTPLRSPVGLAAAATVFVVVAGAAVYWRVMPDRSTASPSQAVAIAATATEAEAENKNPMQTAAVPLPPAPLTSFGGNGTAIPAVPTPQPLAPVMPPTTALAPATPVALAPTTKHESKPEGHAKPAGEVGTSKVEQLAPESSNPAGRLADQQTAGMSEARTSPGQGEADSQPTLAPEPEAVADDEVPTQRNVPLTKLLETPDAYADELITLERVYCLGKTPWRLPDGSLRVEIVESDLELTEKSAEVRMGNVFGLGLDQRLAEQLVQLDKMEKSQDSHPTTSDWIMQPANLTLKVERGVGGDQRIAVPRIVRAEFFERFKNEIRGSYKKKLVVLFETQTVTPNGVTYGLGNHDEWQKVRKLGHAYNQFQRYFETIQRQQSQMKWAAFSRQLNSIIAEGTRQSVSAQAELQRQLRRSTTPR